MSGFARAPYLDNRAVDSVYTAVDDAMRAGWSVAKFQRECAAAWAQERQAQAKQEALEWQAHR